MIIISNRYRRRFKTYYCHHMFLVFLATVLYCGIPGWNGVKILATHSWVMYFFVHNYAGFYTCVTLCTILYASAYNFVRSYVQIVHNYVQFCT